MTTDYIKATGNLLATYHSDLNVFVKFAVVRNCHKECLYVLAKLSVVICVKVLHCH